MRIGKASLAFRKVAPISASSAEDMTVLIDLARGVDDAAVGGEGGGFVAIFD